MADPTRVGTEQNRRSTDAYYMDIIKQLETLQSKMQSGAYLTAAETEQLNAVSQDFETLRTSDPERFDRLVGFVNQVRKSTGTTGPNGALPLSGILNTTFSENQNRKTTSATDTTRLGRKYVDLPTPEEFLDNFTNAYNIHITGLVQSGAIRPEVADFARNFQNEVFGEYLREQTARVLKGEPLWKVVGADANVQQVGQREGQSQISQQQGTQESTTDYARTEASTGGAATPSTTGAGQAVDSGGTTAGTTTTKEDQASVDVQREQELIMSRNNLTYVANLAPLDFFKNAATAQRLNFLYAGQKGTATRARETAAGGEYAGARRV